MIPKTDSYPLPVQKTFRARKWVAAGILLALFIAGIGWWREYERRPRDPQIARRIEMFHTRTGGTHTALAESLRRINSGNYHADRNELNTALAGVLEAPLPDDIKTQGILLVWVRQQGADLSSFPVLNRSLSVELLEWCLQNGADPNMQDKQGNTALHYHRNEKELATLLNAGADPSIRNKEGRTPLENAVLRGEPEAVRTLLQEETAGRRLQRPPQVPSP